VPHICTESGCSRHDEWVFPFPLRERDIPARLRVGYANYFRKGYWEDHCVCEHGTGARWVRLDAQLGPRARSGLGISFDIAEVPQTPWRSAASIWGDIRSDRIDPSTCGVSCAGISGAWFVAAVVDARCRSAGRHRVSALGLLGSRPFICANRNVTEEQAWDIDVLAKTLDPAPPNREAAERVLARFPWARPTPTILSFPEGRPGAEVELAAD
jgi:hypothetical protein